MSADAVSLSALRYRWPGAARACLDIADFTLAAGERLFLHGPSGSGKTTLLSLIGGVLRPEGGKLRVLGTELAALGGPRRDRFRADHIGIIFQQFNLIPYLSGADNIALPCRFSPLRAQRAGNVSAAVARLAAHLDLPAGLLARPAAELSVGQQQRVAAARALIGAPALVIADEPTSSLDAARQDAFLALLLAECTAAGASLLFVSHDLRLAGRFDRQAALTELNHAAEVEA
ncbi:MAG: ATP-binding cassette domain-containing protein [Rhodocyclales bacterium]|nr:ATP-binding cassette domain-containing protein [Rhodocyclales bacterium]